MAGKIIELETGRKDPVHLFAKGFGHELRAFQRRLIPGSRNDIRQPDHERRNSNAVLGFDSLLPLNAVKFQMKKFTQKLAVPVKGQEYLLFWLLS